ncbi:MAG TPA: 4-hydroxy-tetrahydrodipicolinate synthase [Actinomycetota bacterium]
MAGRFGAVLTAMITPFGEDGSLDLDAVQVHASYLLEHGTDALVVAGSTGESPTLTHKEKLELWRASVEAAKGKGQVVAGTGTYSTAETVELSHEAADCGVDGLLVVTPYYNKPPQRGLVAHFGKVAESSPLPILMYNIPGRTATRIEHATLLTLAEIPNIVGVKDSTGDLDGISKLVREAPAGFDVYSGDDWATFATACLGGAGIVSVASHLVGERISQMLQLVFDGDVPSARKIHEELSPVFAALFITSNPIPLKAALELVGRPAGEPRLPLLPATPEERETIRQALEDAGLL